MRISHCRSLGDDADNPRYIETLSRRGYRFGAPFTEPAASPQPTRPDSPSKFGFETHRRIGTQNRLCDIERQQKREVELQELLSSGMDWTADSKSVFATGWTANGIPVVLGVEPNGNHRVLLEGERAARYWWAIPSPDGRYLALEVVTRENNVWMVENF